ncbi:unnamed protein product [Prunus armeniaca]
MNHGCRNQIPNTRLEEPDASGMPPEFVSDHERHVDIEPVVPTFEDRTGCSREVVLGLPATVTDTVQTVGKLPAPSPQLPAMLPPTPPSLGTSGTVANTSPQLPAVLPCGEMGDAPIIGTCEGHLSEKSMSWENSFMAFKAFFDDGTKILRSIDELLPLCQKFDGYASVQGAFVYPETIAIFFWTL